MAVSRSCKGTNTQRCDDIHRCNYSLEGVMECYGTMESRYHNQFHFAILMATFLAILMVGADLNRGAAFHSEWPCHRKESTRILVGGASLSPNLALDRLLPEPAKSKLCRGIQFS